MPFQRGDKIRIRKDLLSPGDSDRVTFVAVEDETDGRVRIEPDFDVPFPKPQTVESADLFEPAVHPR